MITEELRSGDKKLTSKMSRWISAIRSSPVSQIFNVHPSEQRSSFAFLSLHFSSITECLPSFCGRKTHYRLLNRSCGENKVQSWSFILKGIVAIQIAQGIFQDLLFILKGTRVLASSLVPSIWYILAGSSVSLRSTSYLDENLQRLAEMVSKNTFRFTFCDVPIQLGTFEGIKKNIPTSGYQ